jgi:hypothetical protein
MRFALCGCITAVAALNTAHAADGLSEDERIALIRGLNAEYATVKDFLPRSKKPLDFNADGTYDKSHWADIGRQNGPAARVGDQVQVTRVTIDKDRLVLEINGGIRSGGHWTDHVQIGMGGGTRPIDNGGNSNATSGTYIQVLFHGPLSGVKANDVKVAMAPVLDFDKRTVTELYSQTLSPETQKAIAEKRVEKGMDREQVFMAMGRPERKLRETKDGVDLEDWIFGRPPGKIVFVTFAGAKVVKVKETYAGLGAEAAAPLEPPK